MIIIRPLITIVTLFFLCTYVTYSQEQKVIATQGTTYTNGSNTMDFTIGEVVVKTVTNDTVDLTQGFHQTLLEITLVEDSAVNFNVNIFPNPASEFVQLNIKEYEGLIYSLYNDIGQLLKRETLVSETTMINVSMYAKGTYMLGLTFQENEKIKKLKIYKIIKI